MVDTDGAEAADFRTYEPAHSASLGEVAKSHGVDEIEYLYDHFHAGEGTGAQYQPGHGLGQHTKYGKNDLDGTRDLMLHPACVVGLADSGAHVGVQTE